MSQHLTSNQSLFIIGCGDVGMRAALAAQDLGYDSVLGIVRSQASVVGLQTQGIKACCVDLEQPAQLAELDTKQSLVLYMAPPVTHGQGSTDIGMQNFLLHCQHKPPARIVYISTSGVYGDCKGAVVNEDAQPNPMTDRARLRLDAEKQLTAFSNHYHTSVIILRVAGIYGSGRLPVERIQAGMVVICPEQAPPSNRIHADDLAGICLRALRHAPDGATYNVADGEASTMTEYFYMVADIAGLPRPPCVPFANAAQHISPGMMSFLNESRILDCSKLFDELKPELRYPDLATGIRASLEGSS